MCQFIEISNQMELNGKVSNIEQKNLYNTILYKKNFQRLRLRHLAPFDWKFQYSIGTLRAKDPRKMYLFYKREDQSMLRPLRL